MARRHGAVTMVPKAESAEELERITASLPGVQVIGLVETAAGVMNARSLAEVDGVVRLALGTFDLAAELGVAPDDRDAMAAARGQLVLASASAGIAPPVDGPTGTIDDESAVRADVEFAKRLGYSGKLCIHPRQVPAAAMALAPSGEELAWAAQVVEAAGAAAIAVVDGKMIDRPVVTRAGRILAAHESWRRDGDV